MFLAHCRGRQIVNQAFGKGIVLQLVRPTEVCWSDDVANNRLLDAVITQCMAIRSGPNPFILTLLAIKRVFILARLGQACCRG